MTVMKFIPNKEKPVFLRFISLFLGHGLSQIKTIMWILEV